MAEVPNSKDNSKGDCGKGGVKNPANFLGTMQKRKTEEARKAFPADLRFLFSGILK